MSTPIKRVAILLVWCALAFTILYLLIGVALFGAGHGERGTDVQKIHVVKEKK